MRKVMVPLDFSETSMAALKIGLALANKLKADLRIVYVKASQSFASGYEGVTSAADHVAMLEKVISDNRIKYSVDGGRMDYKVREGNISDEIINQAKYDDTTIVVMGSHGVSGITQSWIGGNTYRLICNAPCPVLVVRPGMNYDEEFKRIAFSIDIKKSSRIIVPTVAGVAKIFYAKAILIGLQHSGIRAIFDRISSSIKQVEKYLTKTAKLEVEKTMILKGEDLEGKFIEAIAASQADMVAINVNNTGIFLMDRFRPMLTTLINNSNCPVLAIPIKD